MNTKLDKSDKVTKNESKKNQTQAVASEQESLEITATSQDNEDITELCEDMEMVSPGAMLREARKALSLSQEHIAAKLNFKISLVKSIEEDDFDPSLPATFNRGYLANYAKLVDIDVVDVLASYDALDAASIQRSEMLSFSKGTTKKAEQSRVMWISYLIGAVFIGLTILWWLQENRQQQENKTIVPKVETIFDKSTKPTSPAIAEQALPTSEKVVENEKIAVVGQHNETSTNTASEEVTETSEAELSEAIDTLLSESLQTPPPVLSKAVFSFKGDCWVNIFDAQGERIAWGVKKAGYVMSIEGVAPLKITVGKPELTSITFNDEPVDMSVFNTGNIAKFTLPLAE